MVEAARFSTPRTSLERLFSPFQRFARTEASGGIVLLLSATVALVWSNAPFAASYFDLWHTPLTVGAPGLHLTLSLHEWVNDGLMAAFFFLVGLEVKRELLFGELASRGRAALPIAAAAGGMVVPAVLYLVVAGGGEGMRGWGIPMATDIAFALGILALFGRRVPVQLKVFLAALAIADDIGAVLVIALFYTGQISWSAVGIALGVFAVVLAASRAGLRWPAAYALLGLPLWLALLASGIHASIAGVLMAIAIPAHPRLNATEFLRRGRHVVATLKRLAGFRPGVVPTAEELEAIRQLQESCLHAQTPLQRIEHALHPWVAFGIVPIFALANAGVHLGDVSFHAGAGVSLGVLAGLVAGKPVGILGASWLALRLGAAAPGGVSWLLLAGVACLGGIGFTMSIYVADLAFEDPLLSAAKVGILGASALAALLGTVFLRRGLARKAPSRA